MTVTVISCLYGDRGYERFVPRWAEGIAGLTTPPDHVIVACDRQYPVPCTQLLVTDSDWDYPQAFYLDTALAAVETDWVWIADIDDVAMPDALDGLEHVAADVWQMGYLNSEGEQYVPPQLTATEVLRSERNPFVAGSAIRTEALRRVGGFTDVALQDWALWRRLARAGATFESSTRAHFHYMRHPDTRGAVELDAANRPHHLAEMLAWEALAYA